MKAPEVVVHHVDNVTIQGRKFDSFKTVTLSINGIGPNKENEQMLVVTLYLDEDRNKFEQVFQQLDPMDLTTFREARDD